MLTTEEAQQLILTRIKARQDAQTFLIVNDRTIERPFGWLFFVAVSGSNTTSTETTHRLIIVNKHVEQVIESSIEYAPERLIDIYEALLAESQASGKNWCLTMLPLPWGRSERARLAKKANELGLREIR